MCECLDVDLNQFKTLLFTQGLRFESAVQVLKNEPYKDVPLLNGKFTEGQYTHKIYHLASKVIVILLPR